MRKSEFRERRALSVRMTIWQSRAYDASATSMKSGSIKPRIIVACLGLIGLGLSVPAVAVPGGEIDTLTIGRYTCELPGDALGPRGDLQPAEDFAITFGSSYRVKGVRGTYLLTGDTVVMTSGPRKGERYNRISQGFLRRQNADGSDGNLRCVIANRTNTFAF